MNLTDIISAMQDEVDKRKAAESTLRMLFNMFQNQKPYSYEYVKPEVVVENCQERNATDHNYVVTLKMTKSELDAFCRAGLNLPEFEIED